MTSAGAPEAEAADRQNQDINHTTYRWRDRSPMVWNCAATAAILLGTSMFGIWLTGMALAITGVGNITDPMLAVLWLIPTFILITGGCIIAKLDGSSQRTEK